MNQSIDPLRKKIKIDWGTAKKNPFANLISPKEKLVMIIKAAYQDSKLTKNEFIDVVESVIS